MSTDNADPTPNPAVPGGDQYVPDESRQPGEDDMLLGSTDPLDEGLTAPDDDPLAGLDLTPAGEREGEELDDRLAREEPEVWEDEPAMNDDPEASPQAGRGLAGEPAPGGGQAPEESALHVDAGPDAEIAVDEGSSVTPD